MREAPHCSFGLQRYEICAGNAAGSFKPQATDAVKFA
jgi:hypothetical protein